MIRILDRYLIREVSLALFLGLFLFTFIMLTMAVQRVAELFARKGADFSIFFETIVLYLPATLVLTIPMAVLLATLVTFGRLSADSELIAMKAAGIRMSRLTLPVMVLAVICWFVTCFVYLYIVPAANHQASSLHTKIIRSRNPYMMFKERVFVGFENQVVYIDKIPTQNKEMEGVFIYDMGAPGGHSVTIFARKGQIQYDEEKDQIIFDLFDGAQHSVPRGDRRNYLVDSFDRNRITIPLTKFQSMHDRKSERSMTNPELRQEIERRKKKGLSSHSLHVELHKKYSIPFACVAFALIAVPLGISSRRGEKSVGFGISLMLILFYYACLAAGEGLGDEGKIPGWLAMWLPNMILVAIGIFLLRRASNETERGILQYFSDLFRRAHRSLAKLAPGKRKEGIVAQRKARTGTRGFAVVRLLDFYVLGEFLRVFFVVIGVILALSFIVHLFERIDDFVEYKTTPFIALKYLLYRMPKFAFISIHVSVLITTIISLLLLSRRSELIAAMASGISLYRVTLPILVLALGISALSFWFNEKIIPECNKRLEYIWDIEIRNLPSRTTFHLGRRWFRGDDNRIYFYRMYEREKDKMFGFACYRFGSGGVLRERIEADKVYWDGDHWEMTNARLIRFSEEGRVISDEIIPDRDLPIKEKPAYFRRENRDSEAMNYKELKSHIRLLAGGGYDVTSYLVDLHQKISLPILSFVCALIAIPFAVRNPRSSTLIGVGAGIFIGALYFFFFKFCISFGYAGKLDPILAAWGANILFGLAGFAAIFRMRS